MTYLGILFLLSFLILLHEVGHLVAAKLVGIPIADFSVGLGPKVWTRR
jgi:regulator of sigma E protease